MSKKSISPVDKVKDIFNSTIDSGNEYSGSNIDIDYYNLLCKATANSKLFKLFNCNLCMFKYKFEDKDSILILFGIPINVNAELTNDAKHVSERIMDVLRVLESCFITLDYMFTHESKEDKFVYIVAIKKLKGDKKKL